MKKGDTPKFNDTPQEGNGFFSDTSCHTDNPSLPSLKMSVQRDHVYPLQFQAKKDRDELIWVRPMEGSKAPYENPESYRGILTESLNRQQSCQGAFLPSSYRPPSDRCGNSARHRNSSSNLNLSASVNFAGALASPRIDRDPGWTLVAEVEKRINHISLDELDQVARAAEYNEMVRKVYAALIFLFHNTVSDEVKESLNPAAAKRVKPHRKNDGPKQLHNSIQHFQKHCSQGDVAEGKRKRVCDLFVNHSS